MTPGIMVIVSLVPIGLVLRNTIIREERIRKIKERSDQIISMIYGNVFIQTSSMTID